MLSFRRPCLLCPQTYWMHANSCPNLATRIGVSVYHEISIKTGFSLSCRQQKFVDKNEYMKILLHWLVFLCMLDGHPLILTWDATQIKLRLAGQGGGNRHLTKCSLLLS